MKYPQWNYDGFNRVVVRLALLVLAVVWLAAMWDENYMLAIANSLFMIVLILVDRGIRN